MSRDEAVALGEGVTAGPWSTGGHHFPSNAITLLLNGAEVGDIPLDQSDRIVQALNLGALVPRLRETVVELHDRVAELEALLDDACSEFPGHDVSRSGLAEAIDAITHDREVQAEAAGQLRAENESLRARLRTQVALVGSLQGAWDRERQRDPTAELAAENAQLRAEVNRLRDHLHVIERAEGVEAATLRRWAFESSLGDRPILPPSEVRELGREVERLRSSLAEAQRQIEEIKP